MLKSGFVLLTCFFVVLFIPTDTCVYRCIPRYDNSQPDFTQVNETTSNLNVKSSNLTGYVYINTSHVVHVTNPKFLSVAIDAFVIRWGWGAFDFSSAKLRNLAKALSPAILRIGGTDADFLIFNETKSKERERDGQLRTIEDQDHRTNFTMTASDWDNINSFAADVGWDILFDLNMLLRNGTEWDSTNAQALMEYTREMGYRVAGWELGNEPNHIQHHSNITIPAEQLARDYINLRKLLNAQGLDQSFLVGPSTTRPVFDMVDDLGDDAVDYLKSFLRVCGDATDVTTFHSYYVNVKDVHLDNFTDYHLMNVLRKQIVKVQQIIQKYRPHLPKYWLGETDGVSGGGAPGLSDSYAAGFLWLDKLGLSAKYGVDLVIRQSFYGKYYGLLTNDTLHPTPCYWLSLLYKQLVGQVVLDANITVSDIIVQDGVLQRTPTHVRIYAHCAKIRPDSTEITGNITVFILNLQSMKHVSLSLTDTLAGSTVYQYLLKPYGHDGITAKNVSLNGKELKLTDSGDIPDLKGLKLIDGDPLYLPPLSYGFFVIESNATACTGRRTT